MPSHINISWSNEDFISENFQGHSFINCKFSNCDFNDCNFDGAKLINCQFSNCDFFDTDLSHTRSINTKFVNCDMEYSSEDDTDTDSSYEMAERFEKPSSSHEILEPVHLVSSESPPQAQKDEATQSTTGIKDFNFGGSAFHREIT